MPSMEEILLQQARRRAGFKTHVVIFFLGNIFLWILYALFYYLFEFTFPWAIFPTAIWFIVILFHYFFVYNWTEKWVKKEYQKLLNEHQKSNSMLDNQKA